MRLLISVASADEARAAIAGGAEIIDAKDPTRGAMAAVEPATLRAIMLAADGERPVSAALGDALSPADAERGARAAAAERVAYVKVGFAGVADASLVERTLAATVRGVEAVSMSAGVIAVAYADAERAGAIAPDRLIESAERAGAVGVLLDTAFKEGGGLFRIMSEAAVAVWVQAARDAALVVALAGGLGMTDLGAARAVGADIAGVRGAACDGGRTGRVSAERVAWLAMSAGRRSGPHRPILAHRSDIVTSSATPR